MINPETKEDLDKPVLLFSGLEDAYIGTVEQYGRPPVACYSKQMTIDLLQKNITLQSNKLLKDMNMNTYKQTFGRVRHVS